MVRGASIVGAADTTASAETGAGAFTERRRLTAGGRVFTGGAIGTSAASRAVLRVTRAPTGCVAGISKPLGVSCGADGVSGCVGSGAGSSFPAVRLHLITEAGSNTGV